MHDLTWSEITTMSPSKLESIGFKPYSKEQNSYCIPLDLYGLIPDGTTLTSIFGEKRTKGIDYIDLDTRFGCIAYYVIPKIATKKCDNNE